MATATAVRILRLQHVLETTGLSKSQLYVYLAAGVFPAPVELGARAVGWIDTDVYDWVRARPSKKIFAEAV